MKKDKVDDFLEKFSEGELFDLVFSTFLPLLEEADRRSPLAFPNERPVQEEEEEKKKRKKRKARVKKDTPKPKTSEEEVETDGRRRGRRKRNKPWGAVSTDTQDFNPLEGRRRTRRGEKQKVEKKIEPKIIPHPIPERGAEIKQLTQEIANQTAQKFLDCIPPEMKEVLTEEQIKYQQYELSVGIAESVKSQLEWALNQAWLDAKSNNQSNHNRSN